MVRKPTSKNYKYLLMDVNKEKAFQYLTEKGTRANWKPYFLYVLNIQHRQGSPNSYTPMKV